MARITTPLTDTQIKTAKSQDKDYSLSDGNGLYLLIKSNGSKIWRFNYYRPITKIRSLISFGSYPEVSLQQTQLNRFILTTSPSLFQNSKQCDWSIWTIPDMIMIADILLNLDRQSLMLISQRQNSSINQ